MRKLRLSEDLLASTEFTVDGDEESRKIKVMRKSRAYLACAYMRGERYV